jgi:Fe-S cluster assembly protein SufD
MSVAAETAPYIEAFRARLPADEPEWLSLKRAAALANFGEKGFPTRRQEAWRFTDLRPLQRRAFAPADAVAARPALAAYRIGEAAHRLVLVNGRFRPELSAIAELPQGAWLASTAHTLAERPDLVAAALDETDAAGGQPFASLNAALFSDGFVLALEAGVALDRPVEIVHWGETAAAQSLHLRNLVRLGAGSRARLVESWAGSGAHWTNAVTIAALEKNVKFCHIKLVDEPSDALHFAVTRVALDAAARYESFVLTLGGRLVRRDITARLAGEAAGLHLNGAYLLRGEQEATTAIAVDHAAPGGTTRELYKGVVDDRAHGVFLGAIAVRPEAQRTDAHQLNKNLLLSRRAHVDTKPELEILADDVKCSHGATVGDLDESALFYLRARGIAEAEARRMLIEAFAADAVETVEHGELRAWLTGHVQRWLAGGERR